MQNTLVTGCAGFIGFHLSRRLLEEGRQVIGVDSLNEYYDPDLKLARLSQLTAQPGFRFLKLDLTSGKETERLFLDHAFDCVVHLAAQAGVRYSLTHPQAYVQSNLVGFSNLLEGCRHGSVNHLVFASSSSVYGSTTQMPFSTRQNVDHPVSLYAATKKANELMAHAYAHLYRIPSTGLRFFTVYGPWGRPDMALFLFTKAILEGREIEVFNCGRMRRDFTYVDDIVEGVVRVMAKIPQPDPNWNSRHPDSDTSNAPYRIYNIGNSRPVELITLIELLEARLGKKAQKLLLPMQPGDVPATFADVYDLVRDFDFMPRISIEEGMDRFVEWYRGYYRV